jgi:sugar (pentulose or hexulose) kinase
MNLLLGIDLGTSYFKVGLFDTTGTLKGLGRVAVPSQTPVPDRCELPVALFWQALRSGLDDALEEAGAEVGQIVGISYASQANTFVLMDRWDQPLTPFVIWTDERGEPVEEELKRFADSSEFGQRTGFRGISGAWAVAKWRWWQRDRPDMWAKTRRVMTLPDYLTFILTGERVGDASTAAFLGLYDLAGREWWPTALNAFQIDPDLLSEPLLPGTCCGPTNEGAAIRLGLPAGIPFTVGGLDHHVAGLGSGLDRLGEVSISTGTVLAVMSLVDEVIPRDGCYHGPHFDGLRFYRLAFDPRGAGQLEDYQRRFAPDHSLEQLLDLAAIAEPCGIFDGEPDPNPSDREHGVFVRQILEHIAGAHRDLIGQVMGSRPVNTIVATGGGARSPLWLQIKAAMLGATIVKPQCQELACLGAALLAGVGAGIFRGLDDASHSGVREEVRYVPEPGLLKIYSDWNP